MPEIYSHTVLYTLRKSNLIGKDGKKRYRAQSLKTGSVVSHEKLCEKIAQMAAIPATAVDATLKTLPEALIFFMADLGHKVSLAGIGHFGLEINGSCPEGSLEEPFEKHFKVNPYFRMAPSLRERILAEKLPTIHQVKDLNPIIIHTVSNSRLMDDNMLTRGEAFKVKGKRLRFNDNAKDEGLFLIYPNGRTERRLEGVMIFPAELITALPTDIPTGENYQIEVRARLRNATNPTVRRYQNAIVIKEVVSAQ